MNKENGKGKSCCASSYKCRQYLHMVLRIRSSSNRHHDTETVIMQHLFFVFALFCCAAGQFGSYRGFPNQNAYRPTPAPAYQQPQYTPQYNSPGRFIAIRSQQKDTYPDGTYTFSYDTDNGISVSESGRPQGTGQGQAEVVQGRFSYNAPDGTPITVEYTADENGFHPQGAHLPTPPPIPEAIRRALAANPPGPDDDYRQPYNSNPYRRY
ncbi:endocuticle structural glycoprotein SgAbd-2-like [Hylaeus anthracinus]|uniref:endocuticle structural glycoprotein SgAbd-2-like n=1 Tax=Hylaeus anthracinus TaxID=313031 RepID=UPI0023B92119|nr:endocuticle structural glycoprotein SgAbd-2-like [Hylaeus anthracinus]XP_053997979.1 endocuticle structural glycoprotein SgAbd-2-like [Hylaeus anthracinus]